MCGGNTVHANGLHVTYTYTSINDSGNTLKRIVLVPSWARPFTITLC